MSISFLTHRSALPSSSAPLSGVIGAVSGISSPAWRSIALPPPARDIRLDMFRGMALLMIFMDHIPDNMFGYFTLRSAAFSDAAEVFIFISGFVASLVYGRAFQEQGFLSATLRIYKRVWTIYVAHIVLLVLYIAEVSASVQRFGHTGYNEQLHVADFLAQPNIALLKAVSLQFQPTYLDILPIYIVLLALFPLVLWLLARSAWLVLVPSAIIYLSVQYGHCNLSGFPAPREWYFNPFAWQFLFYLGGVFGFASLRGQAILPKSSSLLIGAWVVATICGALQINAVLHGLWGSIPIVAQPPSWAIDKTSLAPLRLVNFAALAIIATRAVPATSALVKSIWVRPAVLCGQHSLTVFCSNILLALFANVLLHEITGSIWMQAFVNFAGMLTLIGMSFTLSWVNHSTRRPKAAASAS